MTLELAEVLARRSDGLQLLAATPHDGYDPHPASLVELLLEPRLVDGREWPRGDAYRLDVRPTLRGSPSAIQFPSALARLQGWLGRRVIRQAHLEQTRSGGARSEESFEISHSVQHA